MTALPSDDEINAKARELGLTTDDGVVDPRQRAKIVKVLMAETAQNDPSSKSGQLLSRTVTQVGDGYITVEVRRFRGAPK